MATEARTGVTKVIQDNLVKSASDQRDYRALILPNDMQVMLISDKEADKAAAALSVAAGAMHDPFEIPGLAHFLEHMLFLGTTKYPDESGYDKYLRQHAGMSNAYTDRDHTNYYFDVSPVNFSEALDRFSQFFISPLFNEDSTERELNAVDSENSKNVPNDGRRTIRVESFTSNPNHSYSKFTTGNRVSLWTRPRQNGIDTREALLRFYNEYYSSNLMNLVVLGKESLDALQVLVESLFSPVVNKKLEQPFWPQSPYTSNELQVQVNLVPIKELRQLFIKFPVPDTLPHYKTCPMNYVSHLLGHEGTGSLLALLKDKGWVNELSAGGTFPGRGFGIFTVLCQLTLEGWDNRNSIILYLFQYLEMLRRSGPQAYIWNELRDVKEIGFRFKDKSSPAMTVQNLAAKMQQYPLEEAISAGHILTDFNVDLISGILNCLTPEKCRIITNSKFNSETAVLSEEWYGAKYSIEKVDPALIQEWLNCGLNEGLHLPQKNDFIPSVFDIKPEPSGVISDSQAPPELILNNKYASAWHHQDSEFKLPRCDIRIEFTSPFPRISPTYYALTELLKSGVTDLICESTYPAKLAGYKINIYAHIYGLEAEFMGYDHKIGSVLESVIDKILNFTCTEKRFGIIKERYVRSLKNFSGEEPRVHAAWYLNHLLSQYSWTHSEILDALNEITLESLVSYASLFVSRLKLEWLVHGNITRAETIEMITKCVNLLARQGLTPPEQLERVRELQIPEGSDLVLCKEHESHSSSCASVFFQAGVLNLRDSVLIDFLTQIIAQPCFSQLRTKEQLGYVVWTKRRRANGTQGFQILVQSARHPTYVQSRIDAFLNDIQNLLETMSGDEFGVHRESLRVKFAERHKTLSQRSSYFWSEIHNRSYYFNRKKIQLEILGTITHEEVLGFFKTLLRPPVSRRLAVHILSMAEEGAGHQGQGPLPAVSPELSRTSTIIEDTLGWKTKQSLHEHPVPAIDLPSPT